METSVKSTIMLPLVSGICNLIKVSDVCFNKDFFSVETVIIAFNELGN